MTSAERSMMMHERALKKMKQLHWDVINYQQCFPMDNTQICFDAFSINAPPEGWKADIECYILRWECGYPQPSATHPSITWRQIFEYFNKIDKHCKSRP